MNNDINRNLFFIKEHTGIFKAANNYDILDPESGQIIMECREDNLGFITKMLRFSKYKTKTPFEVIIKRRDGKQIVKVKRGISLIRSNVEVFDENDMMIGRFIQKLFSIGGAFRILNKDDKQICYLQGKWTSWDFKFLSDDGKELAHITKEWAGIGKELFTSADNYIVEISESIPVNDPTRKLILAAVICIDMVMKE